MMKTNHPKLIVDDDRPVGRLLTRREVVALLGVAGGAAMLVACAPAALSSIAPSASSATTSPAASASGSVTVPSCIVKPELTEGPYFVDERLERSDIRADSSTGTQQAGVPLTIAFAVARVSGSACTAFQGALVDIWQCNANGDYSDVQDRGLSTVGLDYLRGYQVTDANGSASFTTIYPGWYSGRAVHIHFKIRTDPDSSSGLEFTSQLFLDEGVTDEVFLQEPYAAKGQRDTLNSTDMIYGQGGDQLLLTPGRSGDGYGATFQIGVVA